MQNSNQQQLYQPHVVHQQPPTHSQPQTHLHYQPAADQTQSYTSQQFQAPALQQWHQQQPMASQCGQPPVPVFSSSFQQSYFYYQMPPAAATLPNIQQEFNQNFYQQQEAMALPRHGGSYLPHQQFFTVDRMAPQSNSHFEQPMQQPVLQSNVNNPSVSASTTVPSPSQPFPSSSTLMTTTTATLNSTPITTRPPTIVTIELKVRCTTQLNQTVAVVGSLPDLGHWQVAHSRQMTTDVQTYPVWQTQLNIVANVHTMFEYKFVRLTMASDGKAIAAVEWEQLPGNRTLHMAASMDRKPHLVVQHTFGLEQIVEDKSPVVAHSTPPLVTSAAYPGVILQKVDSNVPQQTYVDICSSFEHNRQTYQVFPQPTIQTSLQSNPAIQDSTKKRWSQLRKRLKEQLEDAFPVEAKQQQLNKEKQKQRKIKRNDISDTTSNASGTLDGSFASTLGGPRMKNLLLAKVKHAPKTVKLNHNECIIQVALQLPYKLISQEVGQFQIQPCFQSPAFLYANLDELAQTKTYNFVWVGIVVTQKKMTAVEEETANKMLAEKNCYAIYFTEQEIIPYLRFYEGLVRPNMHNFIDAGDHLKTEINDWAEFKAINARIARTVHQVRRQVNSQTVWVHSDQLMLVPYYIRQSEKLKANIGFYFHQAFPASAVFQSFYKREELLHSLLHSDLIGFHIWEYARNFINSCQRLLGLYYELGVGNTLIVNYYKRSVQVRIWHIGLDEGFLEKIMHGQKYEQAQTKIINTVKIVAAQNQRPNNVRAIISRGNLNTIQSNIRSASQPTLIALGLNSERYASSKTSTVASSYADNSSQGLNESTQGKIILASIDSLHQMTGLILKLKGYYNFLKIYPEYRDKVVLFQVIRGIFFKSDNMKGQHEQEAEESKQPAQPSQRRTGGGADLGTIWLFDQVESLKKLNTQLCQLVQKIRNEFGRQCLIVESGNWTIHMRLALWSKAHVLFVSTLKDGLYLTCFEYILVKYLCNEFENSAMVLSEFTGCNSQFCGFYDFNPFQHKTIVAALEKCLKDSPVEKAARMKRAYQYCRQRTFRAWVENFLKELKLAYNPHNVDDMCIMYQGLQAVQFGSHGLSKNSMPIPLDIKKHALQAISYRKNLIMIDHEALAFKQLSRGEMCPGVQIIDKIQEILYDKNTIVMIMSDRDRKYVSDVFQSNLMEQENFWVAAESGYWLMTNRKQWTELFKVQSLQWMQTIRQIMAEYCENIDGAVIEERTCTIVWSYKNTEEEHGSKFANQLAQHLEHLLGRHSPIQIVHGNGFIEVQPKKLTKRAVLANVLENLHSFCNYQIESFLYIGADLQDDTNFEFLQERIDQDRHRSSDHQSLDGSPLFAVNCKSVLCVLGNRPSSATYFLEHKDIETLLQEMAFKTRSLKRTNSWTHFNDSEVNNTLYQKEQQSTDKGYLYFQTSEEFDQNSDFSELLAQNSSNSKKKASPPPRKRKHDKVRKFPPDYKAKMYQPEDPITEIDGEDTMTLNSEYCHATNNAGMPDPKDLLSRTIEQLSSPRETNQASLRKNISSELVRQSSNRITAQKQFDIFTMKTRTQSAAGVELGTETRKQQTDVDHLLLQPEDVLKGRKQSQQSPLKLQADRAREEVEIRLFASPFKSETEEKKKRKTSRRNQQLLEQEQSKWQLKIDLVPGVKQTRQEESASALMRADNQQAEEVHDVKQEQPKSAQLVDSEKREIGQAVDSAVTNQNHSSFSDVIGEDHGATQRKRAGRPDTPALRFNNTDDAEQ